MKLIHIHNIPRTAGAGGDVMLDRVTELSKRNGFIVHRWVRSSKNLDKNLRHKLQAFSNGIYSISAYKKMKVLLERHHPDIVQVQNLYPLFSASVLVACRQAGVPVVMRYNSYQLVCPTHFHFHNGRVCERCNGGREHWCILQNCRGNIFESTAYALRTAFARNFRLFKDNVTVFIVMTEFAKRRLIDAGFDRNSIVVIPNMVSAQHSIGDPSKGNYIAFAGRLSREKGITTFLSAISSLPYIPLRVAGDGPIKFQLVNKSPKNVTFSGWLNRDEIHEFYKKARFFVLPSEWYELCPNALLEAMQHGLPVIASRIDGIKEIIDDKITGLLFEPGDHNDLSKKIELLWSNPKLCMKLGAAGREKVVREYNEDIFFKRLISAYKMAITKGKHPF